MKRSWYEDALELLLVKLDEKGRVSGVDFLADFFTDHGPDSDFEEDRAADDFAREEVDGFENWLRHAKGDLIVVGSRYAWKSLDRNDEVAAERPSRTDLKERGFSDIELKLFDSTISTLRPEDYESLSSLYEKVVSGEDKISAAEIALKIAYLADLSAADYMEKVRKWEECGDREDIAGIETCATRYSSGAMIAALNLNHLKAAQLYEKAKSSCQKYYSADRKKLVVLIRSARRQYELSAFDDDASRLYVEENNALIEDSCGFAYLTRKLYGLISDYGESPLKVLYAALSVIVSCALIYAYAGIYSSGAYSQERAAEVVGLSASSGSILESLGIGLYYSVVTFTTLGYGDFSPASAIVRFISAFQAMMGLILTSLFMVTVVRKYSR